MIKNIIIFIILWLIYSISAEESTIYWNPSNKFGNNIYKATDVELKYEGSVPLYYTISPKRINPGEVTDLYLDFDEALNDNAGNYRIIYKKFHISENKAVCKKSAYFIGSDEKIEMVGNDSSFFQSGINLGAFTISFWIYPANFAENQTLLKIGSQYYDKSTDSLDDQSIKAKIVNSKLVWEFKNIFFDKDEKVGSVMIESFSRIMPEKWSNITLVYDSFKGIITSYINNNEEGIAVTAANNDIDLTKYNMRFNKQNRCILMIAPDFFGAIDEFSIKSEKAQGDIDKFNPKGGEILSRVVDFGKGGINIDKIICEDYRENNSDIVYYYRYSGKPFDPDDAYSQDVKWNRLSSSTAINKDARFFQWKAMLLTGINSSSSPRLKGIKISYKENNPPAMPAGIKVLACDGSIDIKWILNSEKDVKGYKIYYGSKSGRYFGVDASEGKSPVDVGLVNRFKLSGLDRRLIYYITITAYDDEDHTHESDFSEEIVTRPLGNCDRE